MAVVKTEFEPGYIVITDDGGRRTKHEIAPVIRSADVPDLTISSLSLLTELANILIVITKTLIDKGILNESYEDGWDLNGLIERLEALSAEF